MFVVGVGGSVLMVGLLKGGTLRAQGKVRWFELNRDSVTETCNTTSNKNQLFEIINPVVGDLINILSEQIRCG